MRDGQVSRDRRDEQFFFSHVSLFPLVSLVILLRVSRQFLFDAFQFG